MNISTNKTELKKLPIDAFGLDLSTDGKSFFLSRLNTEETIKISHIGNAIRVDRTESDVEVVRHYKLVNPDENAIRYELEALLIKQVDDSTVQISHMGDQKNRVLQIRATSAGLCLNTNYSEFMSSELNGQKIIIFRPD